jgi:hypothetical protein
VAYFPTSDITPDALQPMDYTSHHRDLGPTAWYTVRVQLDDTQLHLEPGQAVIPHGSPDRYFEADEVITRKR